MNDNTKYCEYEGCYNAATTKYCSTTCKVRDWRNSNKIKAAYLNLKNNAKRRGKLFTLTFDEFKAFALETELVYKAGKTKLSYTVDRIDENKGYTVDNIQVLTNSDNAKKIRAHERKKRLSAHFGGLFRFQGSPIIDYEDNPF